MNMSTEVGVEGLAGGPKTSIAKAIVAGGIGNVVEWFDWSIYGLFASVISKQFFPSQDPLSSLLLTFAVFAVGFVMRPLGSIVLGPYGDKVGRQKVLSLSVILMGIGTFIIGILPTYKQIGVWAPILLVVARLIQGFSAGGEYGASTSFMVEYAPRSRRGWFGSWQQFSVGLGSLLGSIISTIMIVSMPADSLNAWGWRIPFLIGIIVGIFGLYIRLRIEDTPKYQRVEQAHQLVQQPFKEVFGKYLKNFFQCMGLTMSVAVSYYISLSYMPTYIKAVVHLSFFTAMLTNVLILIYFNVAVLVTGALSDRIGRKPLLITSCAGFVVLSYPMFLLINHGGFFYALIPQLILVTFLSMFSGPGSAALSELFPTRIRNSSISVGYNVSVALFGGTAPFIATYLISVTHNKLSPTYYVIVCAIITLLVLVSVKDRYKEELE